MTACMAGAMPSVHSGLGTIAFAVTAMVVSSGSPTAIQMPSPPRRRPNILYIIADDMRPAWNVYCPSCGLVTPHLDRLASEGLLFQRAYCQEAFCSASRNSFMSGRRTSTTLVWGFPVSFRQSPLGGGGTNWQSMPQYFKNTGGYLTVGGGKTYHTGSPPNFDPPSWSEPAVGGSQPFAYLPPKYGASQGGSTYQQCCRQPFDPAAGCDVLADAGGGFCRVVNESDIFDHRLTQHTIEVLGQAKATSKPFMVFAGYKKPHAPWGVPSRMFDLYEPLREKVRLPKHQYRPLRSPNVSAITDFFLRLDNSTSFDEIYPWGPDQAAPDEVVLRNRQACKFQLRPSPAACNTRLTRRVSNTSCASDYAAVSYIDEQVGKLTEALANLQLRNSTIVVVHADHGFQLGKLALTAKDAVTQ
jgi:iduronate 2-sulfatase